jgi:arginase family enzyme
MPQLASSRVLLAGYDGTSRYPGTSLGAEALWYGLQRSVRHGGARQPSWSALVVSEASKNSAMWCRRLKQQAAERSIDLTLGGEHLVTFPLLEVLVARHPDLRLVVLDAHHDAYDYPLLTHFSLFHYARHELEIPTLIVGVRHELELMPEGCEVISAEQTLRSFRDTLDRMHRFVDGAPFYFSVDLDVLDPTEFAAVSDPVPGGLNVQRLAEVAREMFARAPVAADVVEYNPLNDSRDGAALASLRPFLSEVATWLDWSHRSIS